MSTADLESSTEILHKLWHTQDGQICIFKNDGSQQWSLWINHEQVASLLGVPNQSLGPFATRNEALQTARQIFISANLEPPCTKFYTDERDFRIGNSPFGLSGKSGAWHLIVLDLDSSYFSNQAFLEYEIAEQIQSVWSMENKKAWSTRQQILDWLLQHIQKHHSQSFACFHKNNKCKKLPIDYSLWF